MSISYWNVRNKAERIFGQDAELYYYRTQFLPCTFYYDENNKLVKWYGPNWNVSYDFKHLMTSGPLSIRYNLFGKILDTNPKNLLTEAMPNRLKLKKK